MIQRTLINVNWWKKIKTTVKHHDSLYNLFHPLYSIYRGAIMRMAQGMRGVDGNKLVFSSFESARYGDNPWYISERMHALRPDCDIVWLFTKSAINTVKVPDYVRKVRATSWKGLAELATARFWINNVRFKASLYINTKKQYYIQTWHGDRGFKRVGLDNERPGNHPPTMEYNCAMMIAGSRFGAENYRTAFNYKGEILMDGCPRNDVLLKNDPAMVAGVRRRLNLSADERVLMYAPTYRDFHSRESQKAVLDIRRALDHLEKTTGQRWRCLCRAHHRNTALIVQDDPRIIDATAYPEISELMLVTDMLITDYSSVGGDFALLRRPLFLYHADVAEYLDKCRGFYFDVEKSPFLIAHSHEELEALMDATDAQKARENCEALDRFFGTTETGHATDAVCRYIIDRMDH